MIVDDAAYARIVAYARDRLRDDVDDLLDDPSDLLHPWRDREPHEAIAALRQLAADLGLDFGVLLSTGSPIEQQRLFDIVRGVIAPAAKQDHASPSGRT